MVKQEKQKCESHICGRKNNKMTAQSGSANLITVLSVFVLNMLKSELRGNVTTNQIDAIIKLLSQKMIRIS